MWWCVGVLYVVYVRINTYMCIIMRCGRSQTILCIGRLSA